MLSDVRCIHSGSTLILVSWPNFLESIAGIETTAATPEPEVVDSPSEGPPLPKSGLPEGWTMDQWKWYGQEWLDKNQ